MTDQTFILADGRRLGYSVYGAPDGRPVLYFHGTPSSRHELQLLNAFGIDIKEVLVKAGVRLIAVDRPGMGMSSFHPGRSILSFAHDVYSLSEVLVISQCSVMCWSGGGTYALAVAWQYPVFIKDVFIISGFSQRFDRDVIRQMGMNKWYFLSAKHAPGLLKFTLNKISKSKSRLSLPQWLSRLPEVDHRLMEKPEHLQAIARATLVEACCAGAAGPVQDARLYFDDPGFSLSDLQQAVHFWWGSKDKAVTYIHAEAIEKQIKNGVLHYKEGEGHLSVYVRCFEEVIQVLSGNNNTY